MEDAKLTNVFSLLEHYSNRAPVPVKKTFKIVPSNKEIKSYLKIAMGFAFVNSMFIGSRRTENGLMLGVRTLVI